MIYFRKEVAVRRNQRMEVDEEMSDGVWVN